MGKSESPIGSNTFEKKNVVTVFFKSEQFFDYQKLPLFEVNYSSVYLKCRFE